MRHSIETSSRSVAWLALVTACLLTHSADAQLGASHFIERVELTGIESTRASTLLELLPRPAPAAYSDAELSEVERRIANLEIFDDVSVQRKPPVLRIKVREKWTLTPSFDLAGGESLADVYVFLGLTEYNLFGSASALAGSIYRERRGFGFSTGYWEHVYRRDRWSWAAEASYSTSGLFFMEGAREDSWYTATAVASVWTTSTPVITDHLRYELGFVYKHEKVEDVIGAVRPPDGHMFGGSMLFTWDAYRWEDLTPIGWSATVDVLPGFFFGPHVPQSRHQADVKLKGALRLAQGLGLLARLEGGVTTRGNANHSLLIGSLRGVRGLPDSFYFNWLQLYLNVELRHAVRLAPRWALQGVLFADGGAFEGITATGARGEANVALSTGVGLRLIPTWLSGLVLRFDVGRVYTPEPAYFYQYGLSQYF